jgi:hypothetical protein
MDQLTCNTARWVSTYGATSEMYNAFKAVFTTHGFHDAFLAAVRVTPLSLGTDPSGVKLISLLGTTVEMDAAYELAFLRTGSFDAAFAAAVWAAPEIAFGHPSDKQPRHAQQTVALSRRNLRTLLSKLDRKAAGEETACALIKTDYLHPQYPQSMKSIRVQAVEDAVYYVDRPAGPMHPSDEITIMDPDAATQH